MPLRTIFVNKNRNFHRPTKLTIQTHYASMRLTINKKLYGKKIESLVI